jgi:MFS family permease
MRRQGRDRVSYADIFGEREFRALFASRALSTIGDYVARAALVITVFAETRSAALMGITFALSTLPDLIGGPVLAGLADRFPRRAVMVAADLGRAVLLLCMAVPGVPLVGLWALLFVIRLLDSPFSSAYLSTMAVVLPGRRLVKGSAVTQLVNHVSYTVGYGVGGLVVAATGLSAVLLLNAATFALSGLVIMLGVRVRPATAAAGSAPSWWRSTHAAVRHVAAHPRLRVIALFPLPIAATVVCEALAAPYAAQLRHGPAVAGLLMAAAAAGVVLGLWLLPLVITDLRPWQVVVLSVTSCAPLLAFVAVPGPVVAVVLIVVSGAALYYWIPLAAEFTQTVPDGMRGQAVGLLTTMMKVSQGAAILGFGLAAQYVPSSAVFATSGAVGMAMAAVLSVAWARSGRSAVVRPEPVLGGPPPRRGRRRG